MRTRWAAVPLVALLFAGLTPIGAQAREPYPLLDPDDVAPEVPIDIKSAVVEPFFVLDEAAIAFSLESYEPFGPEAFASRFSLAFLVNYPDTPSPDGDLRLGVHYNDQKGVYRWKATNVLTGQKVATGDVLRPTDTTLTVVLPSETFQAVGGLAINRWKVVGRSPVGVDLAPDRGWGVFTLSFGSR
jgi:hypothetical protein